MGFYATEKKRPWAKKPIDVTFNLPSSGAVTIASCTGSVTEFVPPDYEGSDVSATLLVSTTAAISGSTVTLVTQNGSDDRRYLVKYQATFSDGSRKEKMVLLIVDEDADD